MKRLNKYTKAFIQSKRCPDCFSEMVPYLDRSSVFKLEKNTKKNEYMTLMHPDGLYEMGVFPYGEHKNKFQRKRDKSYSKMTIKKKKNFTMIAGCICPKCHYYSLGIKFKGIEQIK